MAFGLMSIAFGLFFVKLNHVIEYAFFGLFIVWIFGQLKNGELQWIKTPLDLPLLLYVTWILSVIPFSVDSVYSFVEWRKEVAKILMFYFVIQTVATQQQAYRALSAGFLGMIFLSAIESLYFLGQGNPLWTLDYRAGDLTGSSQWFSVYLVMGFPMLWLVWEKAKNYPLWWRKSLIVGFGIWLIGLFLSHTRGAWVAVGIQIFVLGLLKLRNNWWIALGGGGILVGLLFVFLNLALPQDISKLSVFTYAGSMEWRFRTWSLAIQDVFANPLTGIGFGKHSFGKYHTDLSTGLHLNLHNTFLARAVQIGVPGFLFFIWVFVSVIVRTAFLSQKFPDQLGGKLALAINLIVVGIIVRSLFDDMFNGTVAYLFWLFVGIFFSVEKIMLVQKTRIASY